MDHKEGILPGSIRVQAGGEYKKTRSRGKSGCEPEKFNKPRTYGGP